MAETQSTDPQIRALQSSPKSPLVVVEAVPLANSSHPLYCDTSTGTQRPLVTKAFLIYFTAYHIQRYEQLRSSSLLTTYCLASIVMFAIAHALVCNANVWRYMPHTIFTVILPCSQSSFPDSSCWPGGTAAIIMRFFLPPHLHWSFHLVAQSHPHH